MYIYKRSEVLLMINTNITKFRKNIFVMLETTIKYNEPVNISTKDGNAVIISEDDYNGLMETLYLCSLEISILLCLSSCFLLYLYMLV